MKRTRWSVRGALGARSGGVVAALLIALLLAFALLGAGCGGGPTKGQWGNVHYWYEIGLGGVGASLWCGEDEPKGDPHFACEPGENAGHVPGGIRCQKFPGPGGWVTHLCF